MADAAGLRPAAARVSTGPNHLACRICGARLPMPFLDFGPMPLANSFLASPNEASAERRYPLAVVCCAGCGLVQLNHVVPAEQLYRNYIYVSSTSEGVRAHATWLAEKLARQYGWDEGDLVVEIASNDGTVLKAFQRIGTSVLGVEPATNVAAVAAAEGVPTVNEFFTASSARDIRLRSGPASGILGRHVFAHVDDLHDFLEGVDALLADDGVFLIEVPYLGDLIRHLEFDTVYHEHLSYVALTPVMRLCREHGLRLVDVDRVALHGGSVILHMQRESAGTVPSTRLEEMVRQEEADGLTAPETLQAFTRSVEAWRVRFLQCVAELRASGAILIGYGAAAKANTLLNYCPEAARELECILDRSPHKHGRLTPGTHVPVKPVEALRQSRASHMLILAWNFKDEIMRQMRPFADRGGRFVVPIPDPRIL